MREFNARAWVNQRSTSPWRTRKSLHHAGAVGKHRCTVVRTAALAGL